MGRKYKLILFFMAKCFAGIKLIYTFGHRLTETRNKMKQSIKLAELSDLLADNLPDGPLKDWCHEMTIYHTGSTTKAPIKPKADYYGDAVSHALNAVEMGWENRVAYHIERIGKFAAKQGGLYPKNRIIPIYAVPQPTDRKFDSSTFVPRTWK